MSHENQTQEVDQTPKQQSLDLSFSIVFKGFPLTHQTHLESITFLLVGGTSTRVFFLSKASYSNLIDCFHP